MHNKSSVIEDLSLVHAQSYLSSSDEFHFDASQSSNLFQVLYQTDILICFAVFVMEIFLIHGLLALLLYQIHSEHVLYGIAQIAFGV